MLAHQRNDGRDRARSQGRPPWQPQAMALSVPLSTPFPLDGMVQTFCASVLGVPISLGAIQKVLDRVTQAIG